MALGDCNVSLTNNTIVYNQSSGNGGLSTSGEGGAATFSGQNNIIYFNISDDGLQYGSVFGGGETNLTYSCISQELVAVGNIMDDPLFLNPEEIDFILTEDSPCIDAGDPDSSFYDLEDPANPGFALYPAMGTIINDMGAHGGHNNYEPPVDVNDKLVYNQELINLNNYPNPFNPSTTISFSLSQTSSVVNLVIYNLKGQKVNTLANEILDAGTHQVVWNGKDDNGKHVASGIYFYKMKSGNFEETKKMILMK
jgi:FlgD Ig-like domain